MLLRWITIAVSRSHVGEHSPVGRMGATAGCREERRPERPAQGMLLSRQASGGGALKPAYMTGGFKEVGIAP